MAEPVGVAVVGASGYAARELIQILLKHPGVRVTVATSRQDESPRLDAIHPSLAKRIDLACEPFDADRVAERAQFAFLALPHTASMAVVPSLRERGVKVIDLSADYRLTDAQVYEDWYGHAHTDADGLKSAVYGLPELFRSQIPAADLIANPGCYTSTSILALAPLVAEGLIERTGVIIDAKSGVSGAGRSPKLGTHFPECNESFSAYNVGRHRHTPEIDQILTTAGGEGEAVEVIFTPHLVPMDRGIFATIYARPIKPAVEHDLLELYRSFYADSPFVRVINHLPATKDSAFTNFCDITVRVVRGRIVVLACLDNLIKGASGVAVQNLNLMLGAPETTALF
ncbi:N-acetyl-gamma-glutamyl-phosphate reductase [Planctomyces sp. SH-PL62]|uniref:N-acetyl-gamma-glutamyl-phosphate reductase n=1 Tax=Planctomyces sp. SH-PL62 TaxID=1636152 RepID=UPI00078D3B05|nr:N-acetyl-gamma-glutamyl-phosphate reductase [Planctomyces sp. SH-PL62]AMV39958.1 N-acetyl-gamma-glutamyl-phosphate reductase [Planctomyces sp. SH-PL62]